MFGESDDGGRQSPSGRLLPKFVYQESVPQMYAVEKTDGCHQFFIFQNIRVSNNYHVLFNLHNEIQKYIKTVSYNNLEINRIFDVGGNGNKGAGRNLERRYTGKTFNGPRTMEVDTPLERLPYYVKIRQSIPYSQVNRFYVKREK